MDAFSCSTMTFSTRLGASVVSALLHSEALAPESAVREWLSLSWWSRELQSHQLQETGPKPLQTPRHRVECTSKLHSQDVLTWAQMSEPEEKSLLRLVMSPSGCSPYCIRSGVGRLSYRAHI